jgi:hypothetical protein
LLERNDLINLNT